ncbi:MAG: hypothetical protein K0U54_12290, partial [Bacteroidetes bacterium]|nr:hypothetical protein [Bacteroidota bacterium]
MKKNNRILALINIDEPINTLMESTVNLAETLQADVHFFYVKKPIDLTLTENQLAVLRTKVQAEKAVMKLKNA